MKFITDKGSDGKEKEKVIGIAFKDIWGSGRGAENLKGEDKGSAEVWFDRVGEL
ncbi:hypothetical protein M422DRAFT_35525 [Sphaerobolus stellatus SS14]|uniref:Uncharacterized protein n=1 Tax=Sphaerobolus stellatus (strain SS14) TaxID=990650 RepID=A0A0C9TT44_SPHS4|nr:hypothetical protein M422DRAFT_35525 [Sphaerobolus stellatus SS14]